MHSCVLLIICIILVFLLLLWVTASMFTVQAQLCTHGMLPLHMYTHVAHTLVVWQPSKQTVVSSCQATVTINHVAVKIELCLKIFINPYTCNLLYCIVQCNVLCCTVQCSVLAILLCLSVY